MPVFRNRANSELDLGDRLLDGPTIRSCQTELTEPSVTVWCANVLLEAMACGTPAVATDVWGSREVITAPEAGLLVPADDAEALANAVKTIFDNPPARADTRAYAEQYSWDQPAMGMNRIFQSVMAKKNAA